MRKAGEWILAIVLIPVILLTSVILLPVGLVYLPFHFGSRQWYRSRNRGRTFLIGARTRGWHEFIENNVLPILPANVTFLWDEPDEKEKKLLHQTRREIRTPPPRPYLVFVGLWNCRIVPLHPHWIDLKDGCRKRDPETQEKVRISLVEALKSP